MTAVLSAPAPDYRCDGVHTSKRCQLLIGHVGDHARVPAGTLTCLRWDAASRPWIDPGDGLGSITQHQLQWNALGYD